MNYQQLVALDAVIMHPVNTLLEIFEHAYGMFDAQRLYSTDTYENLPDLIDRFTNAQAESLSNSPVDVVTRAPRVLRVEGITMFIWKNGIVFHAVHEEDERWVLWIDDATAEQWGYPMHTGWFIDPAEESYFRTMVTLGLNINITDKDPDDVNSS